ncbi:MAG TPA: cation:proton antiporter [Thiotrichales bacterium]|nr:cation:proton antiporter [Thiotrichales bacterium]
MLDAIFLIFTGAAVLGGLALWTRQPLLLAYILLGALAGPWGMGVIDDPDTIEQISQVGIMFLLFLLGLNLHPQKLVKLFGETLFVTIASGSILALSGAALLMLFGFPLRDALITGGLMLFSSTIIGLKLLPTYQLHHRHTGEIIISILLLQDVVAILFLLLLQGEEGGAGWSGAAWRLAALPLLLGGAWLFERYVLTPVMARFDTIREFMFLAAVGWCLGFSHLAHLLGLSHEMGAFIAGVALASHPISRYIAESLKPLRDFFLVMFFFSLGAGFPWPEMGGVVVPMVGLAILMLALKPVIYAWLLHRAGEKRRLSREIGLRLGQSSEFSLLVAAVAVEAGAISEQAGYLAQGATLITFVVSSYLVVLRLPTPISANERLRRD